RVVQVDFDRGLFRILKSIPADRSRLGERIPLKFAEDGTPGVVAFVARGSREFFRIDTGSNGIALEAEIFDAFVDQELIRLGTPFVSTTAAGSLRDQAGYLNRYSLGQFTHEGLRVERVNMSAVGLQYLSRFQATFDFPGK